MTTVRVGLVRRMTARASRRSLFHNCGVSLPFGSLRISKRTFAGGVPVVLGDLLPDGQEPLPVPLRITAHRRELVEIEDHHQLVGQGLLDGPVQCLKPARADLALGVRLGVLERVEVDADVRKAGFANQLEMLVMKPGPVPGPPKRIVADDVHAPAEPLVLLHRAHGPRRRFLRSPKRRPTLAGSSNEAGEKRPAADADTRFQAGHGSPPTLGFTAPARTRIPAAILHDVPRSTSPLPRPRKWRGGFAWQTRPTPTIMNTVCISPLDPGPLTALETRPCPTSMVPVANPIH